VGRNPSARAEALKQVRYWVSVISTESGDWETKLADGDSEERCSPALLDVELKMTLDDFRQSLTASEPPAGLT
jgi:hypothetical protein